MEIWIRNDRPDAGIDEDRLTRRARTVLDASGCDGDTELSVWLCGDPDIRELHRRYFGLDTPTNVISFAQRDGEFGDVEPGVLGDVVISVDTARRDAEEAGKPVEDEVLFLLIHGVLHLLGYDHEGTESHRAAEMEAREAELYRLALDET